MDGEAIPQRKRGRPRVSEPRSAVSTRIPLRHHDKLATIANRHGRSVSSIVRRAIFLFLKDETSGPPS